MAFAAAGKSRGEQWQTSPTVTLSPQNRSDFYNIRLAVSDIGCAIIRFVNEIVLDVSEARLSTLMRWDGHSAAWA